MRAKRKMIFTMVAIVLVACTGLILIGNLSKGFQNMDPTEWQLREVNEDNLYQKFIIADEDNDGYFEKGENGLTVKIDEDNVIQVDGTSESDHIILVGSYTLKAGTSYVFDSGFAGSTGTAYLCLVDAANEDNVVAASYNGAVVISGAELLEDITVKLEIVVCESKKFENVKIKPILCTGTSADDLVDFYK